VMVHRPAVASYHMRDSASHLGAPAPMVGIIAGG